MNTLEVLNIIGEHNKNIESFSFHTFPSQILIQEQLCEWNNNDQNHFDRAMKVRDWLKLPFWDSIMVTTFNNQNYSSDILKTALRHNHISSLFYVKAEEILFSPLLHNSDKRIAVCSSVLMKDKQVNHIPMLDFHIPVSDVNLDIVENVCNLLEINPGYILNSGESYHFISLNTVAWEDLYMVLSKALRFCPIIDRAWISHQLEEKSCSLRVDKKHGKETMVARVIP